MMCQMATKIAHAAYVMRPTTAPETTAAVTAAKASWKTMKADSGMVVLMRTPLGDEKPPKDAEPMKGSSCEIDCGPKATEYVSKAHSIVTIAIVANDIIIVLTTKRAPTKPP